MVGVVGTPRRTRTNERPQKAACSSNKNLFCGPNQHKTSTNATDTYNETVQLLKKRKSAGVDNIPAELVQAGGEDVITSLTTICNKIWQTGK